MAMLPHHSNKISPKRRGRVFAGGCLGVEIRTNAGKTNAGKKNPLMHHKKSDEIGDVSEHMALRKLIVFFGAKK